MKGGGWRRWAPQVIPRLGLTGRRRWRALVRSWGLQRDGGKRGMDRQRDLGRSWGIRSWGSPQLGLGRSWGSLQLGLGRGRSWW